jgi:hypothetical protein
MSAEHSARLAAALTPAQAARWSSAWSGASVGWRAAPTISGGPNSQAAAGSLLLRIAMHRPAAREAWQGAVHEAHHAHRLAVRRHVQGERKSEAERINALLARRPPPRAAVTWQPPSPTRVVSSRGRRGVADDPETRKRLERDEAEAADQRSAAAAEAEWTRSQAALREAEAAEAEWWDQYLVAKEETRQEAARQAEVARKVAEAEARRLEEERLAAMERKRREEAARAARAKAEAERVEKAAAMQRAEHAAQEAEEKRAKAEALKAERRARKAA